MSANTTNSGTSNGHGNAKMPIVERHEIKFILIFSAVFLMTVALLSFFGLVPSEFETDTSDPNIIDLAKDAAISPVTGGENNQIATSTTVSIAGDKKPVNFELPVRISIPSVGTDGVVTNPVSTDVDVLDEALTHGAVRYPGSGVPGVGNMFIFGHSTGFKIVQNKAYKIFNEIKNAKAGAEVRVYAGKNVYIYKVTSVTEVNKDKTLVSFDTNGPARLTLSTCDSFGTKSDRFVLEAVFDRVDSI
jgi:LPXTG-site transpeptidase (sortase) family protein